MAQDPIRKLFVGCFKSYKKLGGTYNEYFHQVTCNTLPDIRGSRFMSKQVAMTIGKTLHCRTEKNYIIDNTRVSLNVYSKNKYTNIDDIVNVLNFYIFTLNRSGPKSHEPVVNITLYLTSLKKMFPAKLNSVIGVNNVNSGVTVFNQDNRYIVLYRKEELFKVLLHELIHFYRIDFHEYDNAYDDYFIGAYNISVKDPPKNMKNPLALFESYTETLACYGHLLTRYLFKGIKVDTESIEKALKKETIHYRKQAAKVLIFGGLSEDTHVFSYYVAKAAVYSNWSVFCNLLNHQGIRIDTDTKRDAYLEMLKQIISDEFIENLRNTKIPNISKIPLSTLRMTKLTW